eukprot:CAMPEP_0177671914 /NCGR_PEP_ID=MMETSP0447-20121125/25011_1 /TAXON_ID=0 /ORGANISM="Stygamoeba regulata, Strain BSH-02190019" /LENGTH=74 /DNA_ID=CAMNT_0019179445 /DNA_START=220 /DNA_END=444 /DNA_ORIENTATION=+
MRKRKKPTKPKNTLQARGEMDDDERGWTAEQAAEGQCQAEPGKRGPDEAAAEREATLRRRPADEDAWNADGADA